MMLAGRLLLPDRTPAVHTKFELRIRGDVRHHSSHETDADGRFLSLVGRKEDKSEATEIVFTTTEEGGPALVARAAARVMRAGIETLGDLVLGPDALVVSGSCEIDGKPGEIVGAQVESLHVDDKGESRWRTINGLHLTAHEDGAFEFRGQTEHDRLLLRVRSQKHLPVEPIEFSRGQTGLRVVMATGNDLAATMLIPEGAWQNVHSILTRTDQAPEAGEPASRHRARARGREDGRQQADWSGPPAGSYDLSFALDGIPAPFHTITDVTVPPPAAGDPRLVDIDLRDELVVQVIRLFDGEGKSLENPNGGLFPMEQPDAGDLRGYPCWGKEVKVLLPARATRLLAGIQGFRPLVILCEGEPVDARLDPWPKVTVEFVVGVELPDGYRLRASLEPASDRSRRWNAEWYSGYVSELHGPPTSSVEVTDGKVELQVGDQPRRLQLRVRYKRNSMPVALADQRVSITTPSVRVVVDDAALRTAIDAAKKKAE
jgi:hypothetical protein